MASNPNRIARTLPALLAATLLGLPGAAAAEEAQVGIVLEKNVAAGTLELDGGVVLQVTSATVIRGLEGQRISLDEVPAAQKSDGGFEVDGDETIQFEAVQRGRKRVATAIQLLDAPLD